MRGQIQERTSQHVDPHELPSQFLLQLWPQDRTAALVCLDQQKVLRQVFARVCADALAATVALLGRAVAFRSLARPWLPPRAGTARNRTHYTGAKLDNDEQIADNQQLRNQYATTAAVAETVYLCGARTKKGTPCSRRVHGPVRCWQHKGASAMLPQDKLRINE
jgi:hypothetical protein